LGRDRANGREEVARLVRPKIRRGLVEEEELGRFRYGRGQLDELPLERAKRFDREVEHGLEAEPGREGPSFLARLLPADADAETPWLAMEEEALDHAQRGGGERLRHEGRGAGYLERSALELPHAGERLEDRGLPGVALAEDHVERSGCYLEIELLDDPARALGQRHAVNFETGPLAHVPPLLPFPARPRAALA